MIDRDYVVAQAAETGFLPDTLEKVLRLLELLGDISRHPLLSRTLALKGGTALNLFFGPPARLSVDIDLNYIGAVERKAMLAERPRVERALDGLVEAHGYLVQHSAEAHAGRKLFLGYKNVAGTDDQIQVDLNFLHRLPILGVVKKSAWAPPGTPAPTVSLVSPEELFAGKFRAFMDRVLPRDAFDMVRIADAADSIWSAPRTRAVAVGLAGTLNHPLYQLAPRFRSGVSAEEVSKSLYPMLLTSDRPEAETLMQRALAVVHPLLFSPTEGEREYSERLQHGELRPDILVPDDTELAERLARNPALLWKAYNASRYSQRHRTE